MTAKRLLIAAILLIFSAKIHAASQENIIIISIDTLRADHLGCYGYSKDTSPTIDKLAEDGVLFFNTYSHSPKTTQSHMSMMTSLHHEVHKVFTWEKGNFAKRLSDKIPTLAEILKTNGYATVAFTGGSNVNGSLGFDRGFDIYSNNGTINDVLSWLENNRDKKFFIFFHTYSVHDPYFPPAPYNRMYYPEYDGKIFDSAEKAYEGIKTDSMEDWTEKHDRFWKRVDTENANDVKFLVAQYDAAIHFVDNEMVRPLLNKLKELGVYENTLIIFTADHGEAFKEHNVFMHNDLYEEVLHVPLIMVNVNALPKNTKIKQLVRLTDIMPTIFDIAGIRTDSVMQGKSLLAAIRGKNLNLSCYSKFGILKSLRTGPYSYIIKKSPLVYIRYLYDTQKDPKESHDLLKNDENLANKLNKAISKEERKCERLRKHFGSPPNKTVVPNEETIRQLKALGYLQ